MEGRECQVLLQPIASALWGWDWVVRTTKAGRAMGMWTLNPKYP